MAEVHGTCDPAFAAVRDIFQKHVSSGNEVGASICVTIGDKTVIDLWGGYADAAKTNPWKEDTIVPVWSTTKTWMALAMLLLADRGQVDLYAPVTKYWPEFGGDGRDDIQVRHFLNHSAGLPSWDPPLKVPEMFDFALATQKLIQQKPWWAPGTKSGYHLQSQGYLIGELVQRITGKSLGQFIHEEFIDPLNASAYLPVPEKHWSRIGEMIPPEPFKLPPGIEMQSIMVRAMKGTPTPAEVSNTPEFRNVGVGSYAGFSNAAGLNRLLSIVTNNGSSLDGRRFLSPAIIDKIFEEQVNGIDLVIGIPLRFGMGFGLTNPELDWLPSGRVCFWGGWGGSVAIMDLDRKITFTYAMNRMGLGTLGNDRTHDYARAFYGALSGYKSNL
ncbi:beta-lactamase/transpeptidase-like protein [Aspergillus ambiguus]|uniref:serine hydrolase domain-containing protein n=1 Tax=Aspergillus ambiguus TaxID=176160 RepID=UPI003CCD1FBB